MVRVVEAVVRVRRRSVPRGQGVWVVESRVSVYMSKGRQKVCVKELGTAVFSPRPVARVDRSLARVQKAADACLAEIVSMDRNAWLTTHGRTKRVTVVRWVAPSANVAVMEKEAEEAVGARVP